MTASRKLSGGCFFAVDCEHCVRGDLDLPDVMEVCRKFFTETERNPQVSVSMLEAEWMDKLLTRYQGHFDVLSKWAA